MLINLNLPEEGAETFAFLQTIHREAERYYDADSVYLVGIPPATMTCPSPLPGITS